MSGVSSSPRPEYTPRPGATWETRIVTTGEIVVDTDDGDSPFGWRDLDPPAVPNRATRRAIQRAARRKQ
jgi:hypothetical protein